MVKTTILTAGAGLVFGPAAPVGLLIERETPSDGDAGRHDNDCQRAKTSRRSAEQQTQKRCVRLRDGEADGLSRTRAYEKKVTR
jgi:hypothetical protein